MSMRSGSPRRVLGVTRPFGLAVALALVIVCAALWSIALFRVPTDSGSLEARVTAVGATVRCPICPEPIPLNDVQNAQALQMRQFIRERLQRGISEDGVRQELVARYGPDILLAPPQRGFDLLAWLVPLGAIAVCAVATLLAVRRWSGREVLADQFTPVTDAGLAGNSDLKRYEDLLDRELDARE